MIYTHCYIIQGAALGLNQGTHTVSQVNAFDIEQSFKYQASPAAVDDVYLASGHMREHWRYVMESLEALGAQAFQERQDKALRILRDDGATYNVYSEHLSPAHTWKLDLVPSLITSEEWASIETGLQERADVFNLLLKDLYGPRDLIRTGVIPPDALYCHHGFLRACQGVQMPGNHQLVLHSVDLLRQGDGNVTVLADRTQSPSGAGYALENRTVLSRVLPSVYRDSHVHRLALFFQKLRTVLNRLCQTQDQPRVVVLTPGTHNETYFEHAYLANYLGFHLVQSGDLVVRNGYVWMKALDGLSRVDVILRRVDDWYCDPVELKGDSQLGVPGLLEVVRSGRVVVANPLGSGILENPVFLKYLPQIAQALLGRELRLPSVTTYWLGDAKDRAYVLQCIRQWVIKPVYRRSGTNSVWMGSLSDAELAQWLRQIEAHPHQFVAQPALGSAHLPTFCDGQLQPRPALLRSFAVASHSSYTVMPGGLTRVGSSENAFTISNQAGACSKDTWVIASEPERITSNLPAADSPLQLVRDAELISLPSRVVENLFWFGRYAERTEASLRLLRTVFVLLNGEEPVSMTCRRLLLNAVTQVSTTFPGFVSAGDSVLQNPETELFRVINDEKQVGSIRSNLNALLYCADESKELLSSDTLRVINDIRDALNALEPTLYGAQGGRCMAAPEEALDPFVTALMALSGLAYESMIRGMGWRFMQMGRRLERALQTTRLLQLLLVPEVNVQDQNMLIQAVLQTSENLISYRRRYRGRMGIQSSLDLLMLDTSNPRSLLYQFEQLRLHIKALPRAIETRHELSLEERAVLEGETMVKLIQLTELCIREDGQRTYLDEVLGKLMGLLGDVNQHVSDKYFDHKTNVRQLVSSNWGNE